MEVQAKNFEIQQNIVRLNEMKNQIEAREQQVQAKLHDVSQQTQLQQQALQETLTAKQSLEINAHQFNITVKLNVAPTKMRLPSYSPSLMFRLRQYSNSSKGIKISKPS